MAKKKGKMGGGLIVPTGGKDGGKKRS